MEASHGVGAAASSSALIVGRRTDFFEYRADCSRPQQGWILHGVAAVPPGEIFAAAEWLSRAKRLAPAYAAAAPYPHMVFDDFLDHDRVWSAAAAFPGPDTTTWKQYRHFNAQKLGKTERATFPEAIGAIFDVLNGPPFVEFLSALTGIDALIADPTLAGGGMHQSLPGGYLNVHADFRAHPSRADWRRRINVLVYLNDRWLPEYGGDLELWSADMQTCVRTIAPVLNRCVIFNTSESAFHGHPQPLTCPAATTRRSLAVYYYTQEAAPVDVRSTIYRSRPGDGMVTSARMALNTLALQAKARIQRLLGGG